MKFRPGASLAALSIALLLTATAWGTPSLLPGAKVASANGQSTHDAVGGLERHPAAGTAAILKKFLRCRTSELRGAKVVDDYGPAGAIGLAVGSLVEGKRQIFGQRASRGTVLGIEAQLRRVWFVEHQLGVLVSQYAV